MESNHTTFEEKVTVSGQEGMEWNGYGYEMRKGSSKGSKSIVLEA
jgi:hypothetical protein